MYVVIRSAWDNILEAKSDQPLKKRGERALDGSLELSPKAVLPVALLCPMNLTQNFLLSKQGSFPLWAPLPASWVGSPLCVSPDLMEQLCWLVSSFSGITVLLHNIKKQLLHMFGSGGFVLFEEKKKT